LHYNECVQSILARKALMSALISLLVVFNLLYFDNRDFIAENHEIPTFHNQDFIAENHEISTEKVLNNDGDRQLQRKQVSPLQNAPNVVHPLKNAPMIAVLVTSRQKDIEDLRLALRSLVFLKGDNPNFLAPVLVFSEGDLSEEQKGVLRESTNRQVEFPLVDFSIFPYGLDLEHMTDSEAVEKFRVADRSEWGYQQMIRFWTSGIWKHPALQPFTSVMRIDSDSCFKAPNDHLPSFKHDRLSYFSQFVGLEDGKNYTIGLLNFAKQFMKENNIQPQNQMLWEYAESTWISQETLPLFQTNFELSRKSWMQSPIVTLWHDALTDSPPYGVFKYRWGDAVTRFLTTAMFASNEMVMSSGVYGYAHKNDCKRNDVETALASLL